MISYKQSIMKLTKREIWALRQMLSFDITRYLMANTHGRLDGGAIFGNDKNKKEFTLPVITV